MDFVRRLQIDGKAKTVVIADDVGNGFQTLPQQGMLVRMDRSEVVFDYVDAVSLGESVIKWRSGEYNYKDGPFAIRGSCVPVLPDSAVGR